MSWRFHTDIPLDLSGWNLPRCDGCGRCSAACPVAEAMDCPPSAVVAMALAGQCDRLARLASPWLCTDCRSCSEACPQGVSVAGFMGFLRQDCHLEQRFEDVPVEVEAVWAWHQAFGTTCRASGRAGHWATFLRYRMRSLDLFTNLHLGLCWLLAGRLRILPRAPSLAMRRLFRGVARSRETSQPDAPSEGSQETAAETKQAASLPEGAEDRRLDAADTEKAEAATTSNQEEERS